MHKTADAWASVSAKGSNRMPTILVVDDSSVDRRLVGGLLAKHTEAKIEYAMQGLEALERIEQSPPDLVLTDLVMPGMNGLELVGAIRSRFSAVPVILMTSRGSEEIAVQALQQGAASYVPKRLLAKNLVETVRRVLAVAYKQKSRANLMGCMTQNQCSFVLCNDCTLIQAMVGYLQDAMVEMGLCEPAECTRVGVALEEALVNALYHGNLEVSSELRGDSDDAYFALVDRRLQEPPYCERRIFVEANLSRDEAAFTIRDEGPGFDPAALPNPYDPDGLERTSGRGVLLMRAFMDEVQFSDRGNLVRMVKRRKQAAPVAKEVEG